MPEHRRLLIMFVLLLILGTGVPSALDAQPATPTTVPTPTIIAMPDPSLMTDMLNRINRVRARRGLEPYQLSAELNAAAQNQANWLVATGLRRHFRPDGNRPSDRIREAGFAFQGWCCGENYYLSIDATPDLVWTFWINSYSHLINIIHWDFTHVGVGMATNGRRHAYVLVFAEALGTPVDVP